MRPAEHVPSHQGQAGTTLLAHTRAHTTRSARPRPRITQAKVSRKVASPAKGAASPAKRPKQATATADEGKRAKGVAGTAQDGRRADATPGVVPATTVAKAVRALLAHHRCAQPAFPPRAQRDDGRRRLLSPPRAQSGDGRRRSLSAALLPGTRCSGHRTRRGAGARRRSSRRRRPSPSRSASSPSRRARSPSRGRSRCRTRSTRRRRATACA